MSRILITLFLIGLTQSYTLLGSNFDTLDESLPSSSEFFPSNSLKLNPTLIEDEDIQKGSSITPEVQSAIKGAIQNAYIFNGDAYYKNIQSIQQALNQKYPGDYSITIFNSSASTQIQPNVTLGVAAYSLNGTWWIYWKGPNHYQTSFAYYISRMGSANSTNTTVKSICYTQNNYTSYTTDVFRNIVYAVETDVGDYLMTEAAQVQNFLKQYAPDKFPNVIVTKNLPFFVCQWNVDNGSSAYSNYLSSTPTKKNTIVSFPKIG